MINTFKVICLDVINFCILYLKKIFLFTIFNKLQSKKHCTFAFLKNSQGVDKRVTICGRIR